MYYFTHSFSLYIIYLISLISSHRPLLHTIHCNRTEDEKGNQKGSSTRKKPFSPSQLLPLEIGATICDCIAKTPYLCISKKPSKTNISEADMEYVQISHVTTMEKHKKYTACLVNQHIDCSLLLSFSFFALWYRLLIAQAMEFLRIVNTIETTKLLIKMAASNAAVAGATSTVSATSVATVVGRTGAFVGAVVLMATVLNPVYIALRINKPTPSPSPYPTITSKVQCPDAGAAMFAGYKVSNASEDRQLLMVTLTNLPERLELFLTNSFSLPTMSEEFTGNNTGSVKVRRNFICVYIEK
jgi:hypothetical protein